jgi:DNA-binding NtrC family response regulator
MLDAFFQNCGCRALSDDDAAAHVLVVDDEPIILEALAATLQLDGFARVTCCESAAQALEVVQSSPVDLVVSDLCMPDMDGIELLARIAALRPEVPRILLTGRADRDAVERVVERARPFALIEKPWCNRRLQSEVCRALSWSRALGKEAGSASDAHRARDLDAVALELLRAFA